MNREHSHALPRYCYGDPALAYEQRESASCKGCSHVREAFGAQYCDKGKKRFPKKCGIYREME